MFNQLYCILIESLQNRRLNLTTIALDKPYDVLWWYERLFHVNNSNHHLFGIKMIFFQHNTYKNINSQKKFKNFCVNIFYDTKKHTSRTKACNNSRYNIFLLCLEKENALKINLTSLLKGGYFPKPIVAFCTNLFKEASQKKNMLTLCQTHHFRLCVNIAKLVFIKFHKIKRVVQFKHVI